MEKQQNFRELISELSKEHKIEATTVYFIILQALNQLEEITDIELKEKELQSIRNLYKVCDDLIKKLDK